MKDFDFYDKNYTTLNDLAKMTSAFSRGVSKIVKKQKEELDENDFKRLYRQIDNLKGPFIENEQVYNKFLEEKLVEPLDVMTIKSNLQKKNTALLDKYRADSGQGGLFFEQQGRNYCKITALGRKKLKEIEKEREKSFDSKQPKLFEENKMKISKERLLEIIQEECEVAIGPKMGYEMTPDGEIDREGRMAKRQLADIAEYAQELEQMLQDETQLEAWVQAKLTKAADYIKTVKHYVEYGMEEGAYDQVIPQMDPEMMPSMSNAEESGLNGVIMKENVEK